CAPRHTPLNHPAARHRRGGGDGSQPAPRAGRLGAGRTPHRRNGAAPPMALPSRPLRPGATAPARPEPERREGTARSMGDSYRISAQAWLDQDPDPATREELAGLLDAGDEAGLADRFGARLEFGTAGLRGRLGAGPN